MPSTWCGRSWSKTWGSYLAAMFKVGGVEAGPGGRVSLLAAAAFARALAEGSTLRRAAGTMAITIIYNRIGTNGPVAKAR